MLFPVGQGHPGQTLTPLKFQAFGEGNIEKLFCLGRLGLEEKNQMLLFSDSVHRESSASPRGKPARGQTARGMRQRNLSETSVATFTPNPCLASKRKVPQPHRGVNLLPVKIKSIAKPGCNQSQTQCPASLFLSNIQTIPKWTPSNDVMFMASIQTGTLPHYTQAEEPRCLHEGHTCSRFYFLLYLVIVCGGCSVSLEVRGQLVGISSLLPCGSLALAASALTCSDILPAHQTFF